MQANAADKVTKKATGSVLMRGISCARDNSDVMPRARLVKTETVAGSEISSAAGRIASLVRVHCRSEEAVSNGYG